MAIIYINPAAGTNGTGTTASPKNTLAGLVLAAGDTARIMRGTSYTGAFTMNVSGTSVAKINVETYANADGTDNPFLPKPILNITAPVSAYQTVNRDYVNYRNLDVRANMTVANDVVAFSLGEGSVFENMDVTSNTGTVSVWNKNNVTISGCTLSGTSHSATNNNTVLVVATDSVNVKNIRILNNKLLHRGGGSVLSHLLRVESNSTAYELTGVLIEGNTFRPATGTINTNRSAIAMRLTHCPKAVVRKNTAYGMLTGVYVNGGGKNIDKLRIEYNNFSGCINFGVHLTSYTQNFLIQHNVCNRNGTSTHTTDVPAYGRGIEMSSALGEGSCSGHTIRFNDCSYNVNYGGPLDNGTEGVGIGLDDGTSNCLVYGNTLRFNEGNGVQHFGGNIQQNGGHTISGNMFESNCTAAFTNRRNGGTLINNMNAHLAFNYHKGSPSYAINNVFIGTTLVGISTDGSSQNNVYRANNIFINVRYPITMPSGFSNCANNVFYNSTIPAQRYSDITTAGNNVPVFPALSFIGENDMSFDPKLDAKYRPMTGSPCIGAGKSLVSASDFNGRPFKFPTSVGAFEYYPLTQQLETV